MKEKNFDNRVNKKDLINMVQANLEQRMEIAEGVAETVVNEMLDVIVECLKQDKSILLLGFGTFNTKLHKGHPVAFGKNDMVLDDYRYVKFVASSVLAKKLRSE